MRSDRPGAGGPSEPSQHPVARDPVVPLTEHFSSAVTKIDDPAGFTLHDLQTVFWAIPASLAPRDATGTPRVLSENEMVAILQGVKRTLEHIQTGRSWEELDRWHLDDILSMNRGGGVGYRLILEERIEGHRDLFTALPREPGTLALYLARDALSASEYDRYLQVATGQETPTGVLYYPGLPPHFNYSRYRTDEALDHAHESTAKLFQDVKGVLGNQRGMYEEGADETQFDAALYRKFYQAFRNRLRKLLKTDERLRDDAQFIYQQAVRQGLLNYRRVRVVDMHATGRTIYYVMAVLEYFAREEGHPLKSVDGFIGNGRGQRVGLPKVRPVVPKSTATFSDVEWPFYMTGRNLKGGTAEFHGLPSRYLLLLQVYHSLRLWNEAIEYAKGRPVNSTHSPGGSWRKVLGLPTAAGLAGWWLSAAPAMAADGAGSHGASSSLSPWWWVVALGGAALVLAGWSRGWRLQFEPRALVRQLQDKFGSLKESGAAQNQGHVSLSQQRPERQRHRARLGVTDRTRDLSAPRAQDGGGQWNQPAQRGRESFFVRERPCRSARAARASNPARS